MPDEELKTALRQSHRDAATPSIAAALRYQRRPGRPRRGVIVAAVAAGLILSTPIALELTKPPPPSYAVRLPNYTGALDTPKWGSNWPELVPSHLKRRKS